MHTLQFKTYSQISHKEPTAVPSSFVGLLYKGSEITHTPFEMCSSSSLLIKQLHVRLAFIKSKSVTLKRPGVQLLQKQQRK